MRLIAWLALVAALLAPSLAVARNAAMPPERVPVDAKPSKTTAGDRLMAAIPIATVPSLTPAQPEAERRNAPLALQSARSREPEKEQTAFLITPQSEYGGPSTVLEAQPEHGLTMGSNISTLGVGAEVGYRFNDFLGLRLVGNYFTGELALEYADTDYVADVNLLSTGVMVDYYPFRNNFRLSGGIYYNGNAVGLELPAKDMDFNGVTIPAEQVGPLDGSVRFRRYVPYLGVGYHGNFADGGLVVGVDVGAYFQGMADIELNGSGAFAGHPLFQTNVDAEIDKIEGYLELLAAYPVIRLALSYRF